MPIDPFDGPIPGENYTSDVKNYPWHRPPEVSDLDDAIELASKRLTNPAVLPKILTMIEMKLPLVRIADIFATGGIGAGKWTPDMAIMLAGPLTHMLMILAKSYGIKDYNTGLDRNKKQFVTKAFFEEIGKINEAKMKKAKNSLPEMIPEIKEAAIEIKRSGFASMATQPKEDEVPKSSSVEMMTEEANNAEEM